MAFSPHTSDASHPMRVLFLCTHNSARSQMAERLLRACGGTAYEVFSAGTHPSEVHPLAIKVMHELGIDLSDIGPKAWRKWQSNPRWIWW